METTNRFLHTAPTERSHQTPGAALKELAENRDRSITIVRREIGNA